MALDRRAPRIGDQIMTRIIAIAKPFAAFQRGKYEFSVSDDGTISVWDDVAGYYTTCHSLSEAAQRKIGKVARELEIRS